MDRHHLSMMGAPPRANADSQIPGLLQDMLKGGLALLWRGFEYARELDSDIWEFAVKGDALCLAGLSDIDLRWLIARGYVDCSLKASASGCQEQFPDKNRPWEVTNACFILTKSGAALALEVLSHGLHPGSSLPSENAKMGQDLEPFHDTVYLSLVAVQKPTWDRDRKELRLGARVIKQFRWAAVNQETILMAFEEEGWPARIDDPLPRKLNQDPKNRLHDTIKCLNRNHKERVIHFNGDGTGEGIRWMLLHPGDGDS
jgi:hypothetical protein